MHKLFDRGRVFRCDRWSEILFLDGGAGKNPDRLVYHRVSHRRAMVERRRMHARRGAARTMEARTSPRRAKSHPAQSHLSADLKGRDAILVDTGIGNRLSSMSSAKSFRPRRRMAYRSSARAGDAARRHHPRDPVASSFRSLRRPGASARVRALEAAFPKAKLIVQKGELETAREPRNERLTPPIAI